MTLGDILVTTPEPCRIEFNLSPYWACDYEGLSRVEHGVNNSHIGQIPLALSNRRLITTDPMVQSCFFDRWCFFKMSRLLIRLIVALEILIPVATTTIPIMFVFFLSFPPSKGFRKFRLESLAFEFWILLHVWNWERPLSRTPILRAYRCRYFVSDESHMLPDLW